MDFKYATESRTILIKKRLGVLRILMFFEIYIAYSMDDGWYSPMALIEIGSTASYASGAIELNGVCNHLP
jgi:hypothetical protein